VLIVAGGKYNDDIVLDSTEKLVLAETGTTTMWTEATPLPRGLYFMPSVSSKNRIYILGNFLIYLIAVPAL
jgi:hypothetical protein